MKKLVLLFACAFCMLSASAQSASENEGVTWGVRAGFNLSNQHGYGENAGSKPGFHVGVVADIPIISQYFYVQPGLYYTMKGYKASYSDSDDGYYWKETEKTTPSFLEIPILLSGRYAFNDKVGVQVDFGPYLAIGIAGKYKDEETETYDGETDTDKYDCDYFGDKKGIGGKRFDFGLSVGAGVTFVKHYYLGLHYELGLTNAYKYEKIKNRNFMISLGYNF
ncbi:MAG: PorT family protein [Prevotella sp.]|nr:PorT family protein [Prevotella sp.]